MMELFQRSRAFRIFCNVVFPPFSFLIGMVSSNALSKYTTTGNAVLVVLFIFFALWAWWYGEDRDRRRRERSQVPSDERSGTA